MHKIITFIIFIFVSCLLFTTIYGADWLKWRGPNADGISPENNWNPEALNNLSNIRWETNVGSGHSAVAIRGKYLYTMGNKATVAGKDTTFEDIVFCLDTETGKEVWRYSYLCQQINFPGPRSTPVLDGNFLYTLSWEGHLFCFHALQGNVIWMKNLVSESLSQRPGWGFCGSPVIEGNKVLITSGKAGLALEKKTGKVLWKSDLKQCNLTTPVLFNHDGKQLATFSDEANLYAVNISTGELAWSYQWNATNDPIVLGDKMFLSGGRRGSKLLEINSNNPKVIWESRGLAGSFQGSVVVNNHAYGFGYVKRKQPLQCVDLKTGELKWTKDLGEWGSLIASNGRLIIIDGKGNLIIAEANPTAYKELVRAKVINMPDTSKLDERLRCYCWTNPVLANGNIYVRDNYGNLVCVNMQI